MASSVGSFAAAASFAAGWLEGVVSLAALVSDVTSASAMFTALASFAAELASTGFVGLSFGAGFLDSWLLTSAVSDEPRNTVLATLTAGADAGCTDSADLLALAWLDGDAFSRSALVSGPGGALDGMPISVLVRFGLFIGRGGFEPFCFAVLLALFDASFAAGLVLTPALPALALDELPEPEVVAAAGEGARRSTVMMHKG
jgi:hypothetical protein